MLVVTSLVTLLVSASLAEVVDLTRSNVPESAEHAVWMARVQREMPSLQLMLGNVTSRSPAVHAVSPQCLAHVAIYAAALQNFNLWAITMFDSSTKFPESLLSGAYAALGNFDQCVGVEATSPPGQSVFSAQYCLPSLSVYNEPAQFGLFYMFAACMPATCSAQELQEVLQGMIGPPLSGLGQVTISLTQDGCYTGQDKPTLDPGAVTVLVVFGLLALLLAVATCYDFFTSKKEHNKGAQVLVAFSLRRNLRALGLTAHAAGSVTCLHGLRVFSLFWIMLAHRYIIQSTVPSINLLAIIEWLPRPLNSLVLNAYVGVDTFLFLSGFLLCFVFLNDMRRGRPFNLAKFYLYRYLRLSTALLLVVLYYMTVMPYTGYSPTWRFAVSPAVNLCKKYWWITMTYLNNYVFLDGANTSCIDQSWYLSVDMQLAWLSPLLLVPLWRWPRRTATFVLPTLTLASCLAPFVSTYINEFPMTKDLRNGPEMTERYGKEIYVPTHMRATPYLVGVSLAYLMDRFRDRKITLPKWFVLAGWLTSTGACLSVLSGTAVMYHSDYVYEPVGAAFYAGFHRLAWSLSIAWIVFACSSGYGGAVSWVLSWRALLPFSRLSYCAFLTHFVLLYFDAGHTFTAGYLSHFSNVHKFLGDLFITFCLASVLHLSCEAPTLNLLRLAFNRGPNTKPETKDDAHQPQKSSVDGK